MKMNMVLIQILIIVIPLVENEPISNVCIRTNSNCAQTNGCAYVKGRCEILAGCELYEQQQNCESISKSCIWDGKSQFCQDKRKCENMNFQECGNINQLNGFSCQWKEGKCKQKLCFDYSQADCEKYRDDCYLGSIQGQCLDNGQQCERYSSKNCQQITPPIGECYYSNDGHCLTKQCENYFGDSIRLCEKYQNKDGQKCTYIKNQTCSNPQICITVYEDTCIKDPIPDKIIEQSDCIQFPWLCYKHSGCVDNEGCYLYQSSNQCNASSECKYENNFCRKKKNTCIDTINQQECSNLQCKWENNIVRVKLSCSEVKNEYICLINQSLSEIPCIWSGDSCSQINCDKATKFTTNEECQQIGRNCIIKTNQQGCFAQGKCEDYNSINCESTLSSEGLSCNLSGNKCIKKQCNEYVREECMRSQQCVYTGSQCLPNSEINCNNFIYQNYCFSDKDGSCIWNDDFPENKKCQRFTKCSDIYSFDSPFDCSLYSPCCTNFYNSENLKYECIPNIICRQLDGDTFVKCQIYSKNLASNGIHCIQIADCEYYNEIVCQDSKDSNGNFCFWNSNKCQKRLTYCQGYNSSLCESNVQQTTLEGILCFFDQKNKICRPKQCSDLNEKECDSLKLCIEVNSKTVCEENRCQIPQQGEQKKCQLITSQCIQQKDQFLCQVLGAQEGKCKWENKCLLLERNTTYYNPKDKYRVNPMKDYQSILIFIAVQFIMQF